MDRLDAMSILLAAVEAGSLSAAARRLSTPLATVSRKVSDLEAHLKTRLLHRSSRKLALTEAGTSYVAACRRILADLGEAERAASGEYSAPRGELVVTAPLAFGRLHLVPVLADFLRAYPDIDVHLELNDRVVSLLEEQIDVALRIGTLPDSSPMAARVGTIRRIVCASPAYLAARGTPRTPADLVGHDCITYRGFLAADAWTFYDRGTPVVAPIRSRLTVTSAESAYDAAIAGVGLAALLSYQLATALRAGALDVVLRDFEPAPVPVSLVYGAGRFLPLKLRAFLDFATPRLRARLADVG